MLFIEYPYLASDTDGLDSVSASNHSYNIYSNLYSR